MYPRTASKRCRIRASRSFFTTFNLGKKLCGIPTFGWSRSHVRVPSFGISFQSVAFLRAMLLLAWNTFKACCPDAATSHQPVLPAHFFPGRNRWRAKSRALFDQWLKRHRLPSAFHPMFEDFCAKQWQQHVVALEHSSRLNWAMLQKVKSALHKDLVLYNEDHHPNHVVCFCPRFFLRGLCTTWDGPSVFKSLQGSPEEWQQKMLGQIPSHLSRRHSWTFSKSANLPRGTVFLKRKKQFTKERTIISYWGSLCSKLLELASVAVTL